MDVERRRHRRRASPPRNRRPRRSRLRKASRHEAPSEVSEGASCLGLRYAELTTTADHTVAQPIRRFPCLSVPRFSPDNGKLLPGKPCRLARGLSVSPDPPSELFVRVLSGLIPRRPRTAQLGGRRRCDGWWFRRRLGHRGCLFRDTRCFLGSRDTSGWTIGSGSWAVDRPRRVFGAGREIERWDGHLGPLESGDLALRDAKRPVGPLDDHRIALDADLGSPDRPAIREVHRICIRSCCQGEPSEDGDYPEYPHRVVSFRRPVTRRIPAEHDPAPSRSYHL